MKPTFALAALAGLLAAGCGGGTDPLPPSDYLGSCFMTSLHRCAEYYDPANPGSTSKQTSCEMLGWTWSKDLCPTEDRTGNCKQKTKTDGSYQVDHWYPGEDAAAMRTACQDAGGAWSDP
jgi:hypothetical protein